ncbi:MAG: hypothetical protein GY797_17090 [Deltaproteobacteria bacterium]|nr:hypothetical protein [Deltaproteobacteria bacterium]
MPNKSLEVDPICRYAAHGAPQFSVGRQKAAANAQDEERMLIKLLVIQHLSNKRIEQSQKERSSSWALSEKIILTSTIVQVSIT